MHSALKRRDVMMLDIEKREHTWACHLDRGDVQCPYITTNHRSGSSLNCVWRIGHPDSLPHEAYYDQPDGPAHYDWVVSPNRMRITEVDGDVPHICDDWERGYADGYRRALDHVVLMGCDCERDEECGLCRLVDRLREVQHAP